jgi:hypothetical protein
MKREMMRSWWEVPQSGEEGGGAGKWIEGRAGGLGGR